MEWRKQYLLWIRSELWRERLREWQHRPTQPGGSHQFLTSERGPSATHWRVRLEIYILSHVGLRFNADGEDIGAHRWYSLACTFDGSVLSSTVCKREGRRVAMD